MTFLVARLCATISVQKMGVVFSIHNEENVITPRSTSIFTSPPPSGATSQWLSLLTKLLNTKMTLKPSISMKILSINNFTIKLLSILLRCETLSKKSF